MRHHKFSLSEEDYEGVTATMKWYEAILYGPVFMFNIHLKTLQKANKRYKQEVLTETAFIMLSVVLIFYFDLNFLKYHIAFMMFCEGLMAFFAVWSVHHDTESHPDLPRTQRGTGWKNFITADMFFHLEHHIFPSVPTHNLHILAKRLDEKLPNIEKKQVF